MVSLHRKVCFTVPLSYAEVIQFSDKTFSLFCLIYVSHSGGRDLSGNKRTNTEQTSDQKFERFNEALRLSCEMGYPVRVIRLAVL